MFCMKSFHSFRMWSYLCSLMHDSEVMCRQKVDTLSLDNIMNKSLDDILSTSFQFFFNFIILQLTKAIDKNNRQELQIASLLAPNNLCVSSGQYQLIVNLGPFFFFEFFSSLG